MAERTAANPVLAQSLVDALLGTLTSAPGAALLTTPTVHLFTAGPALITPSTVVADFTEATFVGYLEQALGLIASPINLPNGNGRGRISVTTYVAGAGIVAPGETVLGYWIDNNGSTFYCGERFASPVAFESGGDFLELLAILPVLAFPSI